MYCFGFRRAKALRSLPKTKRRRIFAACEAVKHGRFPACEALPLSKSADGIFADCEAVLRQSMDVFSSVWKAGQAWGSCQFAVGVALGAAGAVVRTTDS